VDDLILVGVVARPHGLNGHVLVNPETDFAEDRFAPGATVLAQIDGKLTPLKVASLRFHQGRPLVGFEGIGTIERAEPLAQQSLWIREADRPALEPGRYYHSDLVGCLVETMTGVVVGRVTRVHDESGGPLLAIGEGAREVLVPLAESICREINPAAKRIVIDPPEGLLELNASKVTSDE
jgi:16S rRNA processing protein RimM